MQKNNNELQKVEGSDLVKKSLKDELLFLDQNLSTLSKELSEIELPRLFYQLVIFVIDGSKSMEGKTINGISKSSEIDKSIRLILKRLKESKNKNCFDISFIPFSENFDKSFGIKNNTDIDENTSFNPFKYISNPGGTLLADAMKYTEKMIDDYLLKHKDKSTQVLVQILSDGAIHDYTKTREVINRLKNNSKVTIACQYIEEEIDENSTYYSWDEATGELDESSKWTIEEVKESEKRIADKFKKFASNEELFITSPNPDEIRNHMIKSITAVSKVV